MDVFDEGAEYRIVCEVPGAVKEQLELGAGPVAGTLSIRIQGRDEAQSTRPLAMERGIRAGPVCYQRLVPVAWDADVAKARPVLADGLLTLWIPKKMDTPSGKEKATK